LQGWQPEVVGLKISAEEYLRARFAGVYIDPSSLPAGALEGNPGNPRPVGRNSLSEVSDYSGWLHWMEKRFKNKLEKINASRNI